MRSAIILLAVVLPGTWRSAHAAVTPASLFADHMVLQRGQPVPVWGTASPGEKVSVSLLRQVKQVLAGSDGKWMIRLDKLSAGGPYTLHISGKNTVTISDVYVGEVWVCSGQSNMDMTVAKEDRYWCGVFNEAEEVAAANYPGIRVFDTDFTPRRTIQNTVEGKWEVVSPQTVGHLSAAAFFFARDLQKRIKVPIGLITTAYGASTAEAWIAQPGLEANPNMKRLLDAFDKKLAQYAIDTTPAGRQAALEKWKLDTAKARVDGKQPPRLVRPADPVRDQHNPYVLWNGMVAPLVPYAMRGVLWYQGESNSPSAEIYRNIMETLIADWRRQWNQGDFPFIYVQLANIGKIIDPDAAHGGQEAIKREAQLLNLSVPNTAMVVAIDNADPGDMNNVHPKNKQEIGRRLALAGMALAYGGKEPYSGPIYSTMKVEGNTVRLRFSSATDGLVLIERKKTDGTYDASITDNRKRAVSAAFSGFAIAGEDKKYVWADARIDGNSVVVSAPGITNPVAIRYGWGNNPPTSLYSKSGLPASPFRTDR